LSESAIDNAALKEIVLESGDARAKRLASAHFLGDHG